MPLKTDPYLYKLITYDDLTSGVQFASMFYSGAFDRGIYSSTGFITPNASGTNIEQSLMAKSILAFSSSSLLIEPGKAPTPNDLADLTKAVLDLEKVALDTSLFYDSINAYIQTTDNLTYLHGTISGVSGAYNHLSAIRTSLGWTGAKDITRTIQEWDTILGSVKAIVGKTSLTGVFSRTMQLEVSASYINNALFGTSDLGEKVGLGDVPLLGTGFETLYNNVLVNSATWKSTYDNLRNAGAACRVGMSILSNDADYTSFYFYHSSSLGPPNLTMTSGMCLKVNAPGYTEIVDDWNEKFTPHKFYYSSSADADMRDHMICSYNYYSGNSHVAPWELWMPAGSVTHSGFWSGSNFTQNNNFDYITGSYGTISGTNILGRFYPYGPNKYPYYEGFMFIGHGHYKRYDTTKEYKETEQTRATFNMPQAELKTKIDLLEAMENYTDQLELIAFGIPALKYSHSSTAYNDTHETRLKVLEDLLATGIDLKRIAYLIASLKSPLSVQGEIGNITIDDDNFQEIQIPNSEYWGSANVAIFPQKIVLNVNEVLGNLPTMAESIGGMNRLTVQSPVRGTPGGPISFKYKYGGGEVGVNAESYLLPDQQILQNFKWVAVRGKLYREEV